VYECGGAGKRSALRAWRRRGRSLTAVIALRPEELDFSEAYVEGDDSARWRSASRHLLAAAGAAIIAIVLATLAAHRTVKRIQSHSGRSTGPGRRRR
jgi:hypothetical protein